jgi:ankyrin repeat protein
LPRSKSPILEADCCGKKRSASEGTNSNKRSRRGSFDDYEDVALTGRILTRPTFYQLHAALECSASRSVLECVLDRYSEQLTQEDDLGKLPLHVAVEHCRSDGSVDFILKNVFKPHTDACFHRDYLGRLPLHLALLNRADCRLIEVMLEANPSSGVDYCDTVDARFADKLPIHMATASDCDISTIFLLLKCDPTVVQSWKPSC